jgi:hypothetical protein
MSIIGSDLTPDDHELIEYARAIVDDNTDGEDGAHTMGAAVRTTDGAMYGTGAFSGRTGDLGGT